MKVKIRCRELSNDGNGDFESEINAFLADMPSEAVKYMKGDELRLGPKKARLS
jgi:hypothetical protein